MLDFEFYAPTRIMFGRDALAGLPAQLHKAEAKKLFLVHDGSKGTQHIVDEVEQVLKANNISYVEFSGIQPNPLLSRVVDGVKVCKKENIDFILAVGGGSVIDTCKGIAAGVKLKDNEDIWKDYLFPKNRFTDAIPMGVVLTIPAAGSEASFGTVITHDELKMKRYSGGEALLPKFAILNPVFTTSLPPYMTACGVFDILSHLMERYFVNFDHIDLSDRMIEAVARTVLNCAPVLVKDPTNYDARAEIMWAGCVAHNKILEMGRTHGDWASHDISHEISSTYDVAHGAALAIITPAWMKYVYKHNPAKFHQFAVRVFDIDIAYDKMDCIAEELVDRLVNFCKVMGLATTLSEIDIDSSKFELMASNALDGREHVGTGNGIYLLNKEDVLNVLKMAE
ncbi:MAG: iron-containing alcohol dehydrogenase [Oscillospiraceae bacterium]|nr:iron-containing alcohol dehydrogenase [Oscillospiraceae bacterium]